MKFDPTKPVQLRSGRNARIIATDRKSGRPIIALIQGTNGSESIFSFYPDGTFLGGGSNSQDDLINIPTEPIVITRYLSVNPELNAVHKFEEPLKPGKNHFRIDFHFHPDGRFHYVNTIMQFE